MDEKQTDSFGNICTIVSGVFLGLAIADQISKTPIHEIQKLASGETLQELKMLPGKQEKKQHEEEQPKRYEHDEKHKEKDDEISELKRKIAEYESKQDDRKYKSGEDGESVY